MEFWWSGNSPNDVARFLWRLRLGSTDVRHVRHASLRDWYDKTEDFHGFSCKVCLGWCFWWSLGRIDHNLPERSKQMDQMNWMYISTTHAQQGEHAEIFIVFLHWQFMSLATWQSIFPGSRLKTSRIFLAHQSPIMISCRIFGHRATNYIQSMTMPLTVSAKECRLNNYHLRKTSGINLGALNAAQETMWARDDLSEFRLCKCVLATNPFDRA